MTSKKERSHTTTRNTRSTLVEQRIEEGEEETERDKNKKKQKGGRDTDRHGLNLCLVHIIPIGFRLSNGQLAHQLSLP